MRVFLVTILCALPVWTSAQTQPIVQMDVAATETVVGQPLMVRIKVLVPTFSPKPPEFPSLEVPGLVVRLPERASGPISERVDGDTWSGVQRSYRVYPLRSGSFEIPAQSVRVTYAKPGGIEPETVDIATDAIRFMSVLPAGAEMLSTPIIAEDFSLKQKLDIEDDIKVGSAIERIVEAKISGTTSILIPPLLLPTQNPVLNEYAKEPSVTDTEDRGVLSGTRVETITYVVTAAGTVELPPVELEWFNLTTNTVETARVEGTTVVVSDGPANTVPESMDWMLLVQIAAGLGVAFWCLYKILPTMRHQLASWRDQFRSSEIYASRQVRHAISQRDINGTYSTLALWSTHFPDIASDALDSDLARVGHRLFNGGPSTERDDSWRQLARRFAMLRKDCLYRQRRARGRNALPPMNTIGSLQSKKKIHF